MNNFTYLFRGFRLEDIAPGCFQLTGQHLEPVYFRTGFRDKNRFLKLSRNQVESSCPCPMKM
jgi:hypothetical protein